VINLVNRTSFYRTRSSSEPPAHANNSTRFRPPANITYSQRNLAKCSATQAKGPLFDSPGPTARSIYQATRPPGRGAPSASRHAESCSGEAVRTREKAFWRNYRGVVTPVMSIRPRAVQHRPFGVILQAMRPTRDTRVSLQRLAHASRISGRCLWRADHRCDAGGSPRELPSRI
jgi:hypothetical protein